MSYQNKEKYTWKIPSHEKPERNKNWYIIAGILIFLMIFFSFFTISHWKLVFLGHNSNFLFALILIVSTILMINHHYEPITEIEFEIDEEGVRLNNKKYLYDRFRNFYIIYKPEENIKNIYFEFKNQLHPRLSIPLLDNDALEIRDFLLNYLEEDVDKTNEPLSEQLTKLLKL